MTTDTASTLAADYAAALDWWREAGVDLDYSDAPTAWLREPEAIAEPDPLPPPRTVPRVSAQPALDRALAREPGAAIGGDQAHWPNDLTAFHEFWLTEPSLDPGSLSDRVAPVGEAGAEVLLLVGQPDEGDREALLSGEQGALVTRILRAMGIDESRVYLASALPRPTPMPDWDELASRGLAALTCQHLKLAAPRRVITFGKGPSMLAARTRPEHPREINHTGRKVSVNVSALDSLMHKRLKARFWRRWLAMVAPQCKRRLRVRPRQSWPPRLCLPRSLAQSGELVARWNGATPCRDGDCAGAERPTERNYRQLFADD
jgi:hypothetical protein